MQLKMFIVDAFTSSRFCGNPAAVVLLQQKMPDTILLNLTCEINQTETAFLEPLEKEGVSEPWSLSDHFSLRWFTPTGEIILCGHATLAAAHVLFHCLGSKSSTIKFSSLSGTLLARRNGPQIVLDFPINSPVPLTAQQERVLNPLVEEVRGSLSVEQVLYSPSLKYLMVRLEDLITRYDLESLHPDSSKLLSLHDGSLVKGIIVTVKGAHAFTQVTGSTKSTATSISSSCSSSSNDTSTDSRGFENYHVASRFFDPWFGFSEDPVTGSAHTVLGPYWSEELNIKFLICRQCSFRGGDIEVTVRDDGRVDLAGHSVTVMQGTIHSDS